MPPPNYDNKAYLQKRVQLVHDLALLHQSYQLVANCAIFENQ